MRRVLVGCLSLALSVAAARASAQEVRWRPVSPDTGSGFAADRPATESGPVALKRPQPFVDKTATPSPAGELTAVAFQQGANPKAQTEQLPQPMPLGPGGQSPDKTNSPKTLTVPGNAGSTDPWGGPIPPWNGGAAFPPQAGGPVVGEGMYLDGTPFGGDFCGGCGDFCGGCRGLFMAPGRCTNHFWVNAEYLLWTIKSQPLPPLVTTSSNPFGDFAPGAIGQMGTSVLFGDSHVASQAFSGARIGGGFWFDPCQIWGLDTSFFILGRQSSDFVAGSNGMPTLFRPFFNTNIPGLNMPISDAEIVAFPGLLAGSVQVRTASQLWGFDTNLRRNLLRSCNGRVDLLLGYRFLDLQESLQIRESLTALVPLSTTTAGDRFMVTDRFGTRNQFNGGQIGLDGEWCWGRFILGGFTKVALGDVHESVSITGNTVFTPVGRMPVTLPGGLLALDSNIGTHFQNRFAVVPEVGVKVGYRITDWCRAFVGYNFLYISDVMRPGEQIDLRVNTAQLPLLGQAPGAAVPPPIVPFRHTDFWAQGVNFGFQFTW
jgi:hypothetical protein